MERKLELGPVGQISRSVTDIGEAEGWYRDVLGLKHLYALQQVGVLRLRRGAAVSRRGSRPSPIRHLLPAVSDIRAAHAQLREKGVEFESPPHI